MGVCVIHGDCREILPTLEAESFDCVVTSPPYFGLRDYGVEGQIGLEPTFDAYVEALCRVFDELWRVLKPRGTAWLNLGDSYTSGGRSTFGTFQPDSKQASHAAIKSAKRAAQPDGLKPKDLIGVPWRVAFALQVRGWWLRSAIIWHKPNPMPESVIDRPTSAYEMVFLLTKAERYFYDAEAISEAAVAADIGSMDGGAQKASDGSNANSGRNYRAQKQAAIAANSNASTARRLGGFNERWDHSERERGSKFTRNARNVWTVATQPYSGAHFATMPRDLAERCIKAGCPAGGHVLDPFGGAGTTGLVADRLGRNATLIELNPSYRDMAAERVRSDAPLFADVS